MPYIKKPDREPFLKWFRTMPRIDSPGQLNYVFTMILQVYIQGPTYTTINDAVGALECCKMELYRRLVAPYEDKKINENGEVYLSAQRSRVAKPRPSRRTGRALKPK